MSSSSNTGTSKLEKYVNIIVSVGAAVVIFGAWAKILHKSFADIMLTIGLLTEAAIFLLYAYLEIKKSEVPAATAAGTAAATPGADLLKETAAPLGVLQSTTAATPSKLAESNRLCSKGCHRAAHSLSV